MSISRTISSALSRASSASSRAVPWGNTSMIWRRVATAFLISSSRGCVSSWSSLSLGSQLGTALLRMLRSSEMTGSLPPLGDAKGPRSKVMSSAVGVIDWEIRAAHERDLSGGVARGFQGSWGRCPQSPASVGGPVHNRAGAPVWPRRSPSAIRAVGLSRRSDGMLLFGMGSPIEVA